EGEVRDGRVSEEIVARGGDAAVAGLDLTVAVRIRSLHDDQILHEAAPTFIVIQRVVGRASDDDTLHAHRTTEHFDAVIARIVDLNVLDNRRRAYAAEGQTVEVVASCSRSQERARIADLEVRQTAAIVGCGGAAIERLRARRDRDAFNRVLTRRPTLRDRGVAATDRRTAEHDETGPFARRRA